MSFVKMWVHIVWAIKKKQSSLKKDMRQQLLTHILENAKEKSIHIDLATVVADHVHCLVLLNPDQSITGLIKSLKSESSFWINRHKLYPGKFEWQAEFFAVSISESGVEQLRTYINKQEAHHQRKTFQQEYEEFISKYGFEAFLNEEI